MNRDEILAEIRRWSGPTGHGGVPSLGLIAVSMSTVVRLADEYPDHADAVSLAEALREAVERFAAMVDAYVPD